MNYIGYLFFRVFILFVQILPFGLLYKISDFFAFLMQYVIRYRKKVISTNLKNSFPEKSLVEINSIRKSFYKNLTDISLESIKGISMSQKTALKRYKISNIEVYNRFREQYSGSFIIAAAHYGNWEWSSLTFNQEFNVPLAAFYKPMTNTLIDSFMKAQRARSGAMLVSISQTGRFFKNYHDKGYGIGMVADQSPSSIKKAHWIDFLNQDTACLHGIGYYSTLYNLPVVFVTPYRKSRGFYEIQFDVLTMKSAEKSTEEITNIYMKKVEEIIKTQPESWLWSHKRWKRKRTQQD